MFFRAASFATFFCSLKMITRDSHKPSASEYFLAGASTGFVISFIEVRFLHSPRRALCWNLDVTVEGTEYNLRRPEINLLCDRAKQTYHLWCALYSLYLSTIAAIKLIYSLLLLELQLQLLDAYRLGKNKTADSSFREQTRLLVQAPIQIRSAFTNFKFTLERLHLQFMRRVSSEMNLNEAYFPTFHLLLPTSYFLFLSVLWANIKSYCWLSINFSIQFY